MGLVLQTAQARGLIKAYSDESAPFPQALIEPGKMLTPVKMAMLSQAEVEAILLKLDVLAMSWNHEGVAAMIADGAEAILMAVRMVKDETKAPFAGILGVGSELDIGWLRVQDIGATATLNAAATSNLGAYAGTSAGIYTWLSSFVAGTAAQIIPQQTMSEEAAVVHLGIIDSIENGITKINGIEFQIAGIAAPRQAINFSIRDSVGSEALPFARFEKPIIIGPEKQQRIRLMPHITGDSKPELLSILVATAIDLTL